MVEILNKQSVLNKRSCKGRFSPTKKTRYNYIQRPKTILRWRSYL